MFHNIDSKSRFTLRITFISIIFRLISIVEEPEEYKPFQSEECGSSQNVKIRVKNSKQYEQFYNTIQIKSGSYIRLSSPFDTYYNETDLSRQSINDPFAEYENVTKSWLIESKYMFCFKVERSPVVGNITYFEHIEKYVAHVPGVGILVQNVTTKLHFPEYAATWIMYEESDIDFSNPVYIYDFMQVDCMGNMWGISTSLMYFSLCCFRYFTKGVHLEPIFFSNYFTNKNSFNNSNCVTNKNS